MRSKAIIFKCYGVLGHENSAVYSTQNIGRYADALVVEFPEECHVTRGPLGGLYVSYKNGMYELLNNRLGSYRGKPVCKFYDRKEKKCVTVKLMIVADK